MVWNAFLLTLLFHLNIVTVRNSDFMLFSENYITHVSYLKGPSQSLEFVSLIFPQIEIATTTKVTYNKYIIH